MKFVLPALLSIILTVFLSKNSVGQVSFSKGSLIKKSYASSTIVAPPVLGKSSNGFFLLSSGMMSSRRVVQLNLDEKMDQIGEEIVVKLPKGKMVREILNLDNQVVVVLWSGKKTSPFEFYTYDFEKSVLGNLLVSIPVDDYPGREELMISVLNDEFEDFLGIVVQPKVEYAHVFRKVVVTDRKLTKIVWSHVVTDPYMEEGSLMGEFQLSDLYFNDPYTLVTRFTRPFLKEEKEETQTDMYHFNGTVVKNLWHDQVIRSTTKKELLSFPMPFVSKSNKVEVYCMFNELKRGILELVKFNIRGDEIGRYPLEGEVAELNTIDRLGVCQYSLPVNSHFEDGKFCLLISEQLSCVDRAYGNTASKKKHFVAAFEVENGELSKEKIIDVGWPDAVFGECNDQIILSNSMSAIVDGKLVNAKRQDVFDNFEPVSKKTQSGYTFHYLLNSELYSLHSEYGTGNMSSQLVKWSFE